LLQILKGIDMGLKNKNIGLIGTGKMGSSLIRGILKSNIVDSSNVYASDIYNQSLENLQNELGINVSNDNKQTVINSDIIILAVKPQVIRKVIAGFKDEITEDKLVISIAAGVPISEIEDELNSGSKLIRVMPNIAATVGESSSAICPGGNTTNEDVENALEIFKTVGTARVVSEDLMDAFTGVSGSGPAYIFPVIEAMADGAVYEGLDRKNALTFAAQTVLGAAKLVLETGSHPAELKDMVTSPGGTTIRGVHELEEHGIRSAFMDAVIESSRRSREMDK
jgi:pyrroline-5-carboxylate reductase